MISSLECPISTSLYNMYIFGTISENDCGGDLHATKSIYLTRNLWCE